MKYKAVIFDLFGTLVDDFIKSEHYAVLSAMADAVHADREDFIREWTESFNLRTGGAHRTEIESTRYVCDVLGIEATDEQIRQASDIRLEYSRRTIVPRPEAIPTIGELKNRGCKVGLISDCSPEAPKIWPETPFDGIFDLTVFSCVVGMKKPDPRIFLYACEELGVKPEECLYVGDGGSSELTGAAVVGMHPIQIRVVPPGEIDVVDRETDWHGDAVSTLDEILEMI